MAKEDRTASQIRKGQEVYEMKEEKPKSIRPTGREEAGSPGAQATQSPAKKGETSLRSGKQKKRGGKKEEQQESNPAFDEGAKQTLGPPWVWQQRPPWGGAKKMLGSQVQWETKKEEGGKNTDLGALVECYKYGS